MIKDVITLANNERIENHLKQFSSLTATPGAGMTRYSYSAEDVKTRNYIKDKMHEYGLKITEDGLGNIFGKLEGTKANAPSVLIGSHFDSVPHGGNYDGPAGIIVALETAALFQEHGIRPAYPLEVIAMIEEEGARFGRGLLGSSGINGLIKEDEFASIRDQDGISVVEALKEAGLDPTLPIHRPAETMKAFLELHIEQGPILEEEEKTIGIVDTIVGLTQLKVTVEGKAGHAGTTPMNRRSDALVTAAAIVSKLPQLVKDEIPGTVITTGQLNVYPNGANVIPDRVTFTIDLRSSEEEAIRSVKRKIETLLNTYQSENIPVTLEEMMFIKPKRMSDTVRRILRESAEKLDLSYMPMQSGAGHDAMVFSDFTETGMLFIPSKDGISHHPDEWSSIEHLAQGADVLFETAKILTEAK